MSMMVAVCHYRCGYASDEIGFCEHCGGAMMLVESQELTMGEAMCRISVAMGICWREVKVAMRRLVTREVDNA